ncbi:hypothetical protein BKA66DRAFT_295776 [Pyrenochaeta sp. MPI-SDFR-AT-0127]|nr:hypothetical protein BKA66DRAFT_295776 [Pyrenochaeta sp. MPI-SDFR-AT-0127]
MGTCGRHRPSLFLDRTIQLQLPCSEHSFRTSSPEQVVTLDGFPSLTDSQIANLKSFAPTIALASILSQAANYAFEHNKSGGQKLPWDHTLEYQIICSQLTRFETFFDCYGDIQMQILNSPLPQHRARLQITESTIFSYILYHLCYCLLQHQFLLRRRLEKCGTRIPTSFLSQAISSCSSHAQELTQTLTNARRSEHKVSATFFSYASTVAGLIHGLEQHSPDGLTRIESSEALQGSLAHLHKKARYWKSSNRMVAALTQFSDVSAHYSSLLDPSLQSVPLELSDIERFYALCDYGTMSTNQSVNSPRADAIDAEYKDLLNNALMLEQNYALEHEDYSGHIDGIIPQMFGHADTGTMLDNLPFALQDFNSAESATTNHISRR